MSFEEWPAEVVYQEHVPARFPMLDQMIVSPGTRDDWLALHHLHYKAEHLPAGANYYRLALNKSLIGVCITSLPRPLLKERSLLFKSTKPCNKDDRLSNTARFSNINANMRVIGRIVLDTMYRGVGAAYRFQNLVARMTGFRFVEIQSAMSKYNQFAQKAGFQMVKPQRSQKFEVGYAFMRAHFNAHPADTAGLIDEIAAMKPAIRDMTMKAMRNFYYRHSALERTGNARYHNKLDDGSRRVDSIPASELIRQFQQMILATPMYGIYFNPDYGRTDIPRLLPLSAFDRQRTDQPLVLK